MVNYCKLCNKYNEVIQKINILKMKKNIIFLTFFLITICSYAQINRRNNYKSVPYRANYQRMALGNRAWFSFEIREGTLWAWGNNSGGCLGDGTFINKYEPTQIGTDNKWVLISNSYTFTLGLKSDGTLWAWGDNSLGQLGDGTTTQRIVPTQIGTDNKWINIVAGNYHSIALKSDGTLWAWGYNGSGQVGDGTLTQRNTPVQIGTDTKWSSIAAGNDHSLAMKTDGTLWSWGSNFYGQLGISTVINQQIPNQVGTDDKWTNIAAAQHHNFAIKVDGTLWAWGENGFGQLGDGTFSNRLLPIKIGNENSWVSVNTAFYHNFGIKANGTLWGWGPNGDGQLGDGTRVDKNTPTRIGSENNWVNAVGGATHSLGLKADGSLWSWGWGALGNLGNGTTQSSVIPIKISSDDKWLNISSGQNHNVGLKSNGKVWGWGDNFVGQFGNGSTTSTNYPNQSSVGNWISFVTGNQHSAGIKSDGTLWTMGWNNNGQLGDGTFVNKSNPTKIGLDSNWISTSLGINFTLGIKSNGTLWAWGINNNGQLGDGTIISKNAPVRIGSDSNWVSISAGGTFSIGIKSNGTLWAWGDNSLGQLGDGTTINKSSPVQIGILTNWISVNSGAAHSIALKSNGTLWAWGNNNYGQLGDGTLINKISPVQIGTDVNWILIEASQSSNHSVAVKSNGSLWSWGSNATGQLGDGTNVNKTAPTQIGTDSWVNIASGTGFTIGLKPSRNNFCASGHNLWGQLGDSTIIDKNVYGCVCIKPNIPFVINKTICKDNNAKISAIGVGLIYWYSQNTGGTFLGKGIDFTTPALTNNSTYYALDSTCQVSNRVPVNVTVNSKPLVGFTTNNPIQIFTGNSFLFNDSTSGLNNTRSWNLGDGTNDTARIISKGYSTSNSFNIKLKVTNNLNCSDSITKIIRVIPNIPTVSSTNLIISNITTNSLQLNWTIGNGQRRIVIAKAINAVNSNPVNGTSYTSSSVFGNGTQLGTGNYVVYKGTGNTVTLTGLSFYTSYFFAVIEQNGDSTLSSYQSTPYLTNNATTLPVKWLSFTAKLKNKNTVLLNWSTASEINNSHFELERLDENWKMIGNVKGNGTTNTLSNYQFMDSTFNNSNQFIYYRLKQIDYDGKFDYSIIKTVEINEVENNFVIYPNPSNGIVNISSNQANAIIKVFDVTGKLVYSQQNNGKQNNIELDLSALSNGVYLIQAHTENGNVSNNKVVISK